MNNNRNKNLKQNIDAFLTDEEKLKMQQENMDCSSGTCVVKSDKSLVERINKRIITEDGRDLLI